MTRFLYYGDIRVTRSLVLYYDYVCFVNRCLSFCTFSFGHSSSIYGFGLSECPFGIFKFFLHPLQDFILVDIRIPKKFSVCIGIFIQGFVQQNYINPCSILISTHEITSIYVIYHFCCFLVFVELRWYLQCVP